MLLSKAYHEYTETVSKKTKCYARYVGDFAASLIIALDIDAPPDDTDQVLSTSLTTIQKILSMLYSRQDLVEHFFSHHVCTQSDLRRMISMYDLNQEVKASPRGGMKLSIEKIAALAKIANGYGVFANDITPEQLNDFLNGSGNPLTLREANQMFGAFIAPISERSLLYCNWQHLLSKNEVVISARGKPLTTEDLRKIVYRAGSTAKYESLYLAVQDLLS